MTASARSKRRAKTAGDGPEAALLASRSPKQKRTIDSKKKSRHPCTGAADRHSRTNCRLHAQNRPNHARPPYSPADFSSAGGGSADVSLSEAGIRSAMAGVIRESITV